MKVLFLCDHTPFRPYGQIWKFRYKYYPILFHAYIVGLACSGWAGGRAILPARHLNSNTPCIYLCSIIIQYLVYWWAPSIGLYGIFHHAYVNTILSKAVAASLGRCHVGTHCMSVCHISCAEVTNEDSYLMHKCSQSVHACS